MPPHSGMPGIHECRKQEAGQRRRLIKLSCAGWLPQDRGFVSGLPLSNSEHRPWAAHNRREGSPPRPASSFRHRMRELLQAVEEIFTSRAIAQMNPTISRAIAVTTMTFCFPAATSLR